METDVAPATVSLKAALGVTRYEGVAGILRGHPALPNRKANCLELDNIAIRGVYTDGLSNQEVNAVWSGQVCYICSAC